MELHSANKNIDILFGLNNKFVRFYPYCGIESNYYKVNNIKKFFGIMTKGGKSILAIEYIFLGTYTTEKNIWAWADMSVTIDKNMKTEISELRSKLLQNINKLTKNTTVNNKIKPFVENDYTVLPTMEIIKIISELMIFLYDITKYTILTNGSRDMIDVILIKRIIHDGTSVIVENNPDSDII